MLAFPYKAIDSLRYEETCRTVETFGTSSRDAQMLGNSWAGFGNSGIRLGIWESGLPALEFTNSHTLPKPRVGFGNSGDGKGHVDQMQRPREKQSVTSTEYLL